jgi:hypothetical protein
MELYNKFVSLEGKESLFQEINTPKKIVFYPHFGFQPSFRENIFQPNRDVGKRLVYKIEIKLQNFNFQKLQRLEEPDRYDGYGFWSITSNSKYLIGLSATTLGKTLDSLITAETMFVRTYNSEIVFIFTIKKKANKINDVSLKIYLSNDCGTPYIDNIRLVKYLLTHQKLIPEESSLKGQEIEITHQRHFRSKKLLKRADFIQTITHNAENFLKYIKPSIWDIVIDTNKLDTPYLVLLKNPQLKSGTFLDRLSSFLVWTNGGFTERDFTKETEFVIREIDVYTLENLTVLDVECALLRIKD